MVTVNHGERRSMNTVLTTLVPEETNVTKVQYGGFPKSGVPFWGSNNKDYSICGSILGSPYFGKLPYTPKPYSNEVGAYSKQ